MHINNVSLKTSLKPSVINLILVFVFLLGTVIIHTSINSFTNHDLFSMEYILSTQNKSFSELSPIILSILLPLIFIIWSIVNLYNRQKAINEFNKVLNIKSIDLSNKSVTFNYNQNNYKVNINYNDIESLELLLETRLKVVRHTHFHQTDLVAVTIVFTDIEGNKYSIQNTPINYYDFLANIATYSKKIQNFSYGFSGQGDNEKFAKVINKYRNSKQNIAKKTSWMPDLTTTSIILLIVGIILFLTSISIPSIIFYDPSAKTEKLINDEQTYDIKVNPQSDYNYLSKKRLYKIRKRHVKNSIFKSDNYEPNEKVFGSIVDNKPWWGTLTCFPLNYKGDYHERIEGDSKVSAQVNNPSALVGLSLAYLPWSLDNNQDFCNSSYSQFVPSSLKYNKKQKHIIATYEIPRDFLKHKVRINGEIKRYPLQLSGLNALDFGYKYVYISNSNNIEMLYTDNNISQNFAEFQDYIHLGGSCKYQDGCNNISPMQHNMMISPMDLPAEVTVKLWKRKPFSKNFNADFYYTIMFQER